MDYDLFDLSFLFEIAIVYLGFLVVDAYFLPSSCT